MQGNTRRELLTAFQYLLIGLIALGATQRWFGHRSGALQMLIWTGIAAVLSFARIVILSLSEWTRRNQWQSVSRRNWD
jgi:hypothetical protein